MTESTGGEYQWRVFCPLWPGARPWMSMNDHDRHWARRARLSEWYRNKTGEAAAGLLIPELRKVYIEGMLSFGDKRHRDTHNYHPTTKPCVDGLVDVGVIPDDDERYLVGPLLLRDESYPKGVTLVISEHA